MRFRFCLLCSELKILTRKVLGFEQTYMYDILVTGQLGTCEGAGQYSFSAKLCKRALDVTAGVFVEAICNADILTIIANALYCGPTRRKAVTGMCLL